MTGMFGEKHVYISSKEYRDFYSSLAKTKSITIFVTVCVVYLRYKSPFDLLETNIAVLIRLHKIR